MKKINISEKGKMAYLCVLFLVLAVSLSIWRSTENARRILGNTLTATTATTTETTTEKPTVMDVEIPVTDVPDTRESTTEKEEKIKPLDYFVSPVDGKVLNHFSNGELVKNEQTNDWRTHNGTDLAAAKNAEVKAINNGVVIAVYRDSLWGTVIEMDHGNRVTAKYCGLNENVYVEKGDSVKSGAAIGTLGVIPIESESSHLHLEIRSGGALINPIDLIQ